MLIINADDLGRDTLATDSCLEGYRRGALNSASLMVFMADSERAAGLARASRLETGLHINFTQPFDGGSDDGAVGRAQKAVVRYLRLGKWAQVVYDPFLNKAFAASFRAQLEEFRRLMGSDPAHFNGHNHMHLSMNMVVDALIPAGSRVRRSFTFRRGEKSAVNRLYRRWLDAWLLKRYVSTDSFYSIDPVGDWDRLRGIVELARRSDVELMVHPWRADHLALLLGEPFKDLIASTPRGAFGDLRRASPSQA